MIKRIDAKSRSEQPWRICFVGSLWHLKKSPDILIDSVAECIAKGFKLELTMVGDGSLRPELEGRARKLGIDECVKFTGQLPPGDAIVKQLDQSDLFILPSRSEGLPRSVLEAMARGLPCIGGNAGGFPELLEDRYMVKPITVQALSRTIINTITDINAMKEAVRRNVKKASEYRTDILQKRRVELYTKLKNITQEWFDSR
jgi:glycosyltransferase involved in cell wall biosynthesis